ncbi:MAG: Lrp/AsnC ligand binding domain-containing protein [Candidatus Thorarchaeota archaeon]
MPKAYVLIRAKSGEMWELQRAIERIDGIKEALVITGPYDLVAYAEVPSANDLRLMLDRVHGLKGIINTETWIVL